MIATQILSEEHQIILKVLECLERIAAEADRDDKLAAEPAGQAVEFLREFADGCHHAKEEDRLFVAMNEKGFPRDAGPIGVMLSEHDQGRLHVRAMAAAVEGASRGEEQAPAAFVTHARAFINLLRGHIDKEDHILFPMADQALDPQAGDSLLDDFRRIESEAGGERHSRYLQLARELCTAYGVAGLDESRISTLATEFL